VEPAPGQLAWERTSGIPSGWGISLSGGGLRSAAFSLGVLQALQAERGLLFGPQCASHLSAVSGGSYTAAAYALAARERQSNPAEFASVDPLAPGSPEEQYILSHADYIKHRPYRFVGLLAANLLSVVALFMWLGVMMADFAVVLTFGDEAIANSSIQITLWSQLRGTPFAMSFLVMIACWFGLARALYADGYWKRAWGAPLAAVLWMADGNTVEAVFAKRHLFTAHNIAISVILSVVTLAVIAVLTLVARARGVQGIAAIALNFIGAILPRLFGLGLVLYVAALYYPYLLSVRTLMDPHVRLLAAGLFFGTLISGFLFSFVPHRASLHREYRQRLESCFAIVRRSGCVVPAGGVLLSDVAPSSKPDLRGPRLLICATANAKARDSTGRQWSFVPFVFSHDQSGVPGIKNALFPTRKLEQRSEPAGFWTRRREPLISLFTAVATTGAAMSPSMGRYTLPSLRFMLAAANIRLGRWIPNPLSERARRLVRERPASRPLDRPRMGPGYDELIPEMLGISGSHVLVSDGGHYDNLGLLALLQAKCAHIVCVDASPEPDGAATELIRVLEIAKAELSIDVNIDQGAFLRNSGGMYRSTHAIATITYADRSQGRLFVIKLGLSADSPPELKRRAESDKGFPHHSTYKQIYSSERMNAYRSLGYVNALRMLAEA
jgi:hypothetical protein